MVWGRYVDLLFITGLFIITMYVLFIALWIEVIRLVDALELRDRKTTLLSLLGVVWVTVLVAVCVYWVVDIVHMPL